jgi:transcription elongation factor Elf1
MKTRKIKILKQFPQHLKCPFCGTNKSAKTLLVPVVGGGKNRTDRVIAIHKRCVLENLMYNKKADVFFALPRIASGK